MVFLISQADDQARGVAITILGWIAAAAVVIYLIQTGVRLGLKAHDQERNPSSGAKADGPGKFIIYGVDRASKMDTTWHVAADSEANARVKAELEGIAVTSIQRE